MEMKEGVAVFFNCAREYVATFSGSMTGCRAGASGLVRGACIVHAL